MSTAVEDQADSIVEQVRRLKEANAAKHGFDIRAIATAAQANQRKHPERMVTRISAHGESEAQGDQSRTRLVSEDEL